MNNYTGMITFLYYNDLNYGIDVMERILGLQLVMDQGWARIYKVNQKGFVGIVKKEKDVSKGDTLVSLNSTNVDDMYELFLYMDVVNLTEIMLFESIPLKSFFFEDKEGHRFEIQEFLKDDDKLRF